MLAIGLTIMATNNAVLTGGGAVVVLNPERKNSCGCSLDRAAILQRLFELTEYPAERLTYFAASYVTIELGPILLSQPARYSTADGGRHGLYYGRRLGARATRTAMLASA